MNNVIKSSFSDLIDAACGIGVYFVDKELNLTASDIKNEELDSSLKEFKKSIKIKYTKNESFTTPYLSNYDERKHALYLFDFDEKPNDFALVDKVLNLKPTDKPPIYEAKDNKLSNILAVIIVIKDNQGNKAAFYQRVFSVTLLQNERGMLNLTTHKTRVVKLNFDVLRISSNFVFAKINEDYLIENVTALENQLDFKKIIHARAEHYLEDIVNMKFSDDFKIFAEKIDEDTSFARKVVKVCKHSAVLEKQISTIDLIDFVKKNNYYKESLRFNEDETLFNLNSISKCKKFLELLDDDFLTSKLTNEDYIARSKDRVK